MMGRVGPLKGIKVANFSWVGVGPITVKYLGDYGATVIRVESHTRPDVLRFLTPFKDGIFNVDYNGFFADYNSSAYGISIDLEKPQAREIAWRLVKWADIIAESFIPGTMKKWGLDYESVRRVRPDIIYFSTCQMGQTGARARYSGYGSLAASLAGFTHITGWPDRGPLPPFGAYTDFVSPRFAATCVMAALDYRRRTGKGQDIDQSQFETSLHLIAPPIMDWSVNGRDMERNGNRLPYSAPHGVYPCKGDDRWCAIGVFTDEEWQAFCRAIGEPDWTKDPRFTTLFRRKQNEDELDSLVGGWTADYTAGQVEAMLQAAGVPSGVVESTKDLFDDPQLKYRGHFRWLEHAVMGRHAYNGPSFRLSRTPDSQFAAPALGQHNEYVFKEILGLSSDEIAELLVQGVITTEADLPEVKPSL